MAVAVPTVDEFMERFPSFEGQEDLIEALIPEAARFVDESWRAEDQKIAIQYLTAHMATTEGTADSLPIISESLGPISTSYAYDSKQNPLFRTEYGRRFWQLLTANAGGGGGAIVVVGGGP